MVQGFNARSFFGNSRIEVLNLTDAEESRE